ncbi:MAG: hypothetical protein M3228_10410 [Actinomycetota bacterium]|nr:hypothetical protein [Actinomycetota bacterium]
MNLAHAWFSVGVVVASGNTAVLRAAGADPRLVLGAVFASAAATGRFAGNALARRLEPVRLLSTGALTAGGETPWLPPKRSVPDR